MFNRLSQRRPTLPLSIYTNASKLSFDKGFLKDEDGDTVMGSYSPRGESSFPTSTPSVPPAPLSFIATFQAPLPPLGVIHAPPSAISPRSPKRPRLESDLTQYAQLQGVPDTPVVRRNSSSTIKSPRSKRRGLFLGTISTTRIPEDKRPRLEVVQGDPGREPDPSSYLRSRCVPPLQNSTNAEVARPYDSVCIWS